MESYDLSHLPPPVHDAVLHVLGTLVQAFVPPVEAVQVAGPSAGGPERFPRSALELQVLECLEEMSPLAMSPLQVATIIHQPHLAVRNTMTALAMLGAIGHPRRSYYTRHALPTEDDSTPSLPSRRYTSRIAALCAPSTHREHTKE